MGLSAVEKLSAVENRAIEAPSFAVLRHRCANDRRFDPNER
jgi:hypothetical protein